MIEKNNKDNYLCGFIWSFNFQIEKTGVVKTVEAEKKDISTENAELILDIANMFEKTLFSSRSSDYSETYKFCFLS